MGSDPAAVSRVNRGQKGASEIRAHPNFLSQKPCQGQESVRLLFVQHLFVDVGLQVNKKQCSRQLQCEVPSSVCFILEVW